jgi:hypothetical protein
MPTTHSASVRVRSRASDRRDSSRRCCHTYCRGTLRGAGTIVLPSVRGFPRLTNHGVFCSNGWRARAAGCRRSCRRPVRCHVTTIKAVSRSLIRSLNPSTRSFVSIRFVLARFDVQRRCWSAMRSGRRACCRANRATRTRTPPLPSSPCSARLCTRSID